jgi:hypothetical protein
MTTHLTPEKILQVGLGFWASKTLLSAVEMEVFTELARHPEDLKTLQGRLGLHPRSARDFLDALVALGFLNRLDGKYHNTPETDLFLDKKKPTYLGGMLDMANSRLFGFWNHLTEGLRTGSPQNEAKEGGESLFAALYASPARLKEFLAAMTGLSHGANLAIRAQVSVEKLQAIRGRRNGARGLGRSSRARQPSLVGVGFDLARWSRSLKSTFSGTGFPGGWASPKVTFSTPRSPRRCRHDGAHPARLEPGRKKLLIRKAYDAVRPGGALIVYESIIDDDRSKNAFGLLMSLNMLIETQGGFDYTGADCMGWMKEIGFKETRVEHLMGPDSMVVGIK